jgi:hypothetical protein
LGSFKRELNAIAKAFADVSGRRGVAVLSGLFVVAVRTLFGMFPHWSGSALFLKVAVFVCWIACVAVVIARTVRMEERFVEASARRSERPGQP